MSEILTAAKDQLQKLRNDAREKEQALALEIRREELVLEGYTQAKAQLANGKDQYNHLKQELANRVISVEAAIDEQVRKLSQDSRNPNVIDEAVRHVAITANRAHGNDYHEEILSRFHAQQVAPYEQNLADYVKEHRKTLQKHGALQ